jgi:hypothetical protein
VAETYQIPLEKLVEEIENVSNEDHNQRTKEIL